MAKKIIYIAFLIVLNAFYVSAQTLPLQTTPMPFNLEALLAEAEKQTFAYRANFTNLLAEEKRVFEKYDKKGNLKDTRIVESNFLVYQSAKNSNFISEYRNVTKVNGKSVGDNAKRAEDFFERVLKSTTADKELERVQNENSRYDKDLIINGITLNQAVVLAAHIRPAFDFKFGGREKIEGREMFAVGYQQKSNSPYILVNEEKGANKLYLGFDIDAPDSIDELNAALRGTLWIDAETFEIWREKRELTVQPDAATMPIVVIETDFEFQKSENIGITPKRIVLTDYALKKKNNDLSVLKETRATFEYTKFSKSDVNVKSGDVKN